jgi:uncharacterized protein
MNAISRIGDVRPDRRLRFPALSVADSAGTSFKHEHLNAILAEGPHTGFFEVHAENYMGAGGPPHQAREFTVPEGWPIHITWAAMALAIMAWGPGRLSIDYALGRLPGLRVKEAASS